MSIQLYSSPMKYKDPNTGNYTNIIGISGNPGRGIASVELNNDYTLTITFTDETSITTTSIRGNGIDTIEKTSTSGLIDTYTITDSDGGTYTFTVSNGMVPSLTIGTVAEGPIAAATITGTSENPILNLVLPNANVPTRVSELENDAGYLTEHQDLSNYVQKTDYATSSTCGVVKSGGRLEVDSSGKLNVRMASDNNIKGGTTNDVVITPGGAHMASFYGLAKAAGDTTQAASSNAVGIYTENAKNAIKAMLDVGTLPETVTGSTPVITATANHRYICGEVTSLNFTPSTSGMCDVRFTSGSTVTVLTVPNTVKWPGWFDPTSLETNTVYEINIEDGVYGVVMTWPV